MMDDNDGQFEEEEQHSATENQWDDTRSSAEQEPFSDIESQLRDDVLQEQDNPDAHTQPPSIYEIILLAFGTWLYMFMVNLRIVRNVYPKTPEIQARMVQNLQFVSGVSTLLQTFFGSQLPVVMVGSTHFLHTFIAIDLDEQNSGLSPGDSSVHLHRLEGVLLVSAILLLVASIFKIGQRVIRLLTPLVVVPFVMCYIAGMTGKPNAIDLCPHIALPMCLVFSFTFSMLSLKRKEQFSIFITILVAWVCVITYSRIDETNLCGKWSASIMENSPWITRPSLFRWGTPQLKAIDMLHGFLVFMIFLVESIIGFILLARQIGVNPPPPAVINRAIGWQGFGILLSSIFGAEFGTSISMEYIGFLELSQVKQHQTQIVQLSALIAIVLSVFGKLTAFVTTLPNVVIVISILITLSFTGWENINASIKMRRRNIVIITIASVASISLTEQTWPVLDHYPFLKIILLSKGFIAVVCTVILDLIHFGRTNDVIPYWPKLYTRTVVEDCDGEARLDRSDVD